MSYSTIYVKGISCQIISIIKIRTWCNDKLRVDVDGDVCPVGVGGAEAVGDDALVPPRVVVLQVGEAQLGGDLATLPVEGVRHVVDAPVGQRSIKLQLGTKTTKNVTHLSRLSSG